MAGQRNKARSVKGPKGRKKEGEGGSSARTVRKGEADKRVKRKK